MIKKALIITLAPLLFLSFSGCTETSEPPPGETDYYLTFNEEGEYVLSDEDLSWIGDFTVSFLFNLHDVPLVSNQDFMVAFYEPVAGTIYGWELGFKLDSLDNALARWYFRNGPSEPRCEKTGWGYQFLTDYWYRITVTFDSWVASGEGDIKYYRDESVIIDEGVNPCETLVGDINFWDSILASPFPDAPLAIGRRGIHHGDNVNCSVDDVRIYNRILAPLEVASLCDGEDITNGLILHWTFNEGSGTTISDTSGNNHHATAYLPDWKEKL